MIILSNIISFLLLTYLTNSFLSPKYNKTKSLLIFVLFFIPLIFITIESKYIFILFLYFIVCFLLYKGSFIQKTLIIIFPILTILWFGDIDCSYFLSTSTTDLFDLLSIPVLNLLLFIITLLTTNYISLKKQKELFNSKYELLQQHYDYNFKFLHDLLHTCNQLNIQFDNQNYENAKEILNQLTQTTYKEFNAIYSQSLVLNYVINNHLNTLLENNIDIKTTVETTFNYLDLYTQFELFDYLLNLAIKACLINQNKIIIIKAKEKNNSVLFKITLPYIVIKKDLLYHDLNKILSHITYELNIKEIDSNYISLLIIFNI